MKKTCFAIFDELFGKEMYLKYNVFTNQISNILVSSLSMLCNVHTYTKISDKAIFFILLSNIIFTMKFYFFTEVNVDFKSYYLEFSGLIKMFFYLN